jgi:hypothetical protein
MPSSVFLDPGQKVKTGLNEPISMLARRQGFHSFGARDCAPLLLHSCSVGGVGGGVDVITRLDLPWNYEV